MLRLGVGDVEILLSAVDQVVTRLSPVLATGHDWRHNPQGAPELHFRPSPEWTYLQRTVVAAIEPFRGGKLRDADPSGAELAGLVERLQREDPDGDHRRSGGPVQPASHLGLAERRFRGAAPRSAATAGVD
jgi:hypothetical protein